MWSVTSSRKPPAPCCVVKTACLVISTSLPQGRPVAYTPEPQGPECSHSNLAGPLFHKEQFITSIFTRSSGWSLSLAESAPALLAWLAPWALPLAEAMSGSVVCQMHMDCLPGEAIGGSPPQALPAHSASCHGLSVVLDPRQALRVCRRYEGESGPALTGPEWTHFKAVFLEHPLKIHKV